MIAFIAFPSFSYGSKTDFEGLTIYHNTPLEEGYENVLRDVMKLVKTSELYDEEFAIELCLDDQSWYPRVINEIRGPAFGFGLANKVILKSKASFIDNKAYGYGQSWQLAELIAHEMIHTFQYNKYGFETLSTPFWKQEGYAEVISRAGRSNYDLVSSISLMISEREKVGGDHWVWITLEDESGVPSEYLRSKNLIQYMMEVEKSNYDQILEDQRTREEVESFMMDWYRSN